MSERYSNQGHTTNMEDLLKRVRYFPDSLEYVDEIFGKLTESGDEPEIAIRKILAATNLVNAANTNRLGATVHFTCEKIMGLLEEDPKKLKV